MKTQTIIPAGALFTLTSGEYSDYRTHAVCRALADLDPDALKQDYCTQFPDKCEEYLFSPSAFLAWLINTVELVEEVEFFEFWTDAYGCVGFNVSKRT